MAKRLGISASELCKLEQGKHNMKGDTAIKMLLELIPHLKKDMALAEATAELYDTVRR
jgi:transcriptional regulator with XRE-family HTH domain